MHRFNRIAAMATIKQTERVQKLMAEVLSSSVVVFVCYCLRTQWALVCCRHV